MLVVLRYIAGHANLGYVYTVGGTHENDLGPRRTRRAQFSEVDGYVGRSKLGSVVLNAIVIVVEGVGTRLIGAYGNSSAVTPMLDQLAAGGLLLDNCFVDSLEIRSQLASLWTGRHAAQHPLADWTIWRELASKQIPGKLITDSRTVAEIAQEFGCSDVVYVDIRSENQLADEAEQCAASEVFSAAIDEVSQQPSGLVWIHSRGLYHAWDAPLEMRKRMTDPDDPDPPSDVMTPVFAVDSQTDPDLIVGWVQVATAQMAVIDQAIEALHTSVQLRSDAACWSWLMTSLGGYPLGEHGQIGDRQQQLYHEKIAVPLIASSMEMRARGIRRGELCQLPDICALLIDFLGCEPPQTIWGRSLLTSGAPSAPVDWELEHKLAWLGDNSWGWIRTPAWSSIMEKHISSKLFVKPDDRWEVNDVASLRREMIEYLQEIMVAANQAATQNDRRQLPAIERDLASFCR